MSGFLGFLASWAACSLVIGLAIGPWLRRTSRHYPPAAASGEPDTDKEHAA